MRKIIIAALCVNMFGCGAIIDATKYKNWEYTRIEKTVPDKACIYKVQEACSREGNDCLNWHKKRAILFDANTVVIQSDEKLKTFSASGWTGSASGGDNSSTLAEYYYCNGTKNLNPS